DQELADAVRQLRHHGIRPGGRFEIEQPGLNYRLSDILCAVGIPQLRRLEELLAARERLAAAYEERLRGLDVELPAAADGDGQGLQAYVVKVDRRDEVLAGLREHGIEAQLGTYALNRLGAYREQGAFPGAQSCEDRTLALPFHLKLTGDDVDR